MISCNPSGADKTPLITACRALVTPHDHNVFEMSLGHLEFHHWDRDPAGKEVAHAKFASPRVLGTHLPAPLIPPSIVESKSHQSWST